MGSGRSGGRRLGVGRRFDGCVGLGGCPGLGVRRCSGCGALGDEQVLPHDRGDSLARDHAGAHDAQQPLAVADAGRVDDRRRGVAGPLTDRLVGLAGRTAVEVHGDVLAEHLLGLGGRRRRRHTREIRRRHRERAGLGEQFECDRVGGHAQCDGAAGLAEVPLQRRLRVQDHREPARPELGDELPHCLGDVGRERVEGRDAGDEHGRRRRALATLGGEQPRDRLGAERVGGDAVDGVGRDHDELPPADGTSRESHAGEQLGVDRAVEDGSHDLPILDQRGRPNGCPDGRFTAKAPAPGHPLSAGRPCDGTATRPRSPPRR